MAKPLIAVVIYYVRNSGELDIEYSGGGGEFFDLVEQDGAGGDGELGELGAFAGAIARGGAQKVNKKGFAFLLHKRKSDGKRGAAGAADAQLDELCACVPRFFNVFGGDGVVAIGFGTFPQTGLKMIGIRFGHFLFVVNV